MKVGFFHVNQGGNQAIPLAMVASVRKAMPDVQIVQFTEPNTPSAVYGVDAVLPNLRPGHPLALAVLSAYASCEGDWLFLDTDVLVQHDVRAIFKEPFDIAVADRNGTLKRKENGSKFMAQMPYNKGSVFSRSQAFWQCAYTLLLNMDAKQQAWMGDQRAMCMAISSGSFNVKILPNRFNYAPLSRTDDLTDKSIIHFKGPRKEWMLGHAATLGI